MSVRGRQAGFIHSASIEGVLPLESRSAPIHDLFCCNGFDRSKRVEVMDGSSAPLARSLALAPTPTLYHCKWPLSVRPWIVQPAVVLQREGLDRDFGNEGTSGSKQAWADNAIIGLRLRRRTRPLRSIAFDADDVVMTIGANFEDQQEGLAACLPHGPPGNPESSRTAAFNVA